MLVLRNCPALELSKPPKAVAEKCSPNDVNIIFFTDKNIFIVITLKNPEND